MKIIQINTINNSGSTGRIAEALGNSIIKNGGTSYIASGRNVGNSNSIEFKIGNKLDFMFHVFLTRIYDKHGFGSKGSTQRMIEWIERVDPDIIHLHNLHGYFVNFPELFSFIKTSNFKVIWTFHDCWPFTGHCTYFDSENCFKWKTRCFKCPKKGSYPKSWFSDNSEENFIEKKRSFTGVQNLTIVTPSEWLQNHVRSSFMGGFQTIMIHNGIDLSIFKPRLESNFLNRFQLQGFHIILGVASIWDRRKGLEDFKLVARELEENFRIVLIGLNRKQIEDLPDNIVGIERTEDVVELSKWYSVSRVFMNPTYQDNFPTTNIEALACGTPVITYDTGGSVESIDENTGIVVEKGKYRELIDGVKRIIASNRQYSKDQCRRRAEQYFDKEDRFQDYVNLYRNLLQHN